MFDTHAHLNFEAFSENYQEVLDNAKSERVSHIMIPGTDIKTSLKAIEIASKNENVWASVGIHPTKDLEKLDTSETIEEIASLAKDSKVIAIGEVGIDYHWFRSNKETQRIFFEKQAKIALEIGKSLIIHNREAHEDLLNIIDSFWNDKLKQRAVFHCCEPKLELLEFANKHDMFIGVDGDVTYDLAKAAFIEKVPLDMLVVETDSPYIIPEPLKSEKVFPNEPKNLKLIVDTVSKIKRINPAEVERITLENAYRLFDL